MTDRGDKILVLDKRIESESLARLVREGFGDMVKFVVDVERGIAAVGGELHADGEQLLLDSGSSPAALWGANYYPGRGPEKCIEFTALINIRPARGNPGMEVSDAGLRTRIQSIARELLGKGEVL